jgi:bacterial/archaeal transporter family-2 protein
MVAAVLLALLNGAMIGTSRILNGRLSTRLGPARTSLWNHAVGFALLTILVAFSLDQFGSADWRAPASAYLGGLLGVLFVAANSHVLTRLGATRTTTLVIGAQMLASVLIEGLGTPAPAKLLGGVGGTALIVLGIRFARRRAAPASGSACNARKSG